MTSSTAKGARARGLMADAKFHGMRVIGKTASRTSRSVRSLRPSELARGRFTVLTVNWNTLDCLRTMLDAITRFSPPGTEVVVADNASKDGSREFLRDAGVKWFELPINLGHGPAMDLATTRVRTEYFVTLDVDAFPVTADWLDVLRGHLENGNEVVGGRLYRSYAHPSMMAMRTQRFREAKHTFIRSAWRTSDDFVHGESWDVAELISRREAPHVALIEASEVRGPGVIGTVYGGLVYHNGVSTHGGPENREAGRIAWQEATDRFLGNP